MIETLTTLQYSTDSVGPWKLYIYEIDSLYHRGGVWFRVTPKYPEEEITASEAWHRVQQARNREIRICDGGDMLVYHAKDGVILYGEDFFQKIGATSSEPGHKGENEKNPPTPAYS